MPKEGTKFFESQIVQIGCTLIGVGLFTSIIIAKLYKALLGDDKEKEDKRNSFITAMKNAGYSDDNITIICNKAADIASALGTNVLQWEFNYNWFDEDEDRVLQILSDVRNITEFNYIAHMYQVETTFSGMLGQKGRSLPADLGKFLSSDDLKELPSFIFQFQDSYNKN